MTKAAMGTINSVAPITNVAVCQHTIRQITERDDHLPGMGVFYGPSGYGKTIAAAYCAHRERAYYIQCQSIWTKRAVLESILLEMGMSPDKTIYKMMLQVQENLALSNRLLIVDEMDHIVEKKSVEIIRDIYEGAQTPILLIGEERLPAKLEKWERFHRRILEFSPAQPASQNDAQIVARQYSPSVVIESDLLNHLVALARGSIGRVCVNISRIAKFGKSEGLDTVGLQEWGERPLYTGRAPVRSRSVA